MTRRIVIPLAGIVVIWALLLGAAQVRLSHDRHYCTGIGAPPPGPQMTNTIYPKADCLKARESVRWGPYHLFGTNNGDK